MEHGGLQVEGGHAFSRAELSFHDTTFGRDLEDKWWFYGTGSWLGGPSPPHRSLRSGPPPPPPRRGIHGIIKMVSQSVIALYGTGGGSGRPPLKKLIDHFATHKDKKIRSRIGRPRIHSATHFPRPSQRVYRPPLERSRFPHQFLS